MAPAHPIKAPRISDDAAQGEPVVHYQAILDALPRSTLAKQLGAQLTIGSADPGARFVLSIPLALFLNLAMERRRPVQSCSPDG